MASSTPAKTTIKVATTNSAAKDDAFSFGDGLSAADGWNFLDVLANDPGSASLYSLGTGTTSSGQMVPLMSSTVSGTLVNGATGSFAGNLKIDGGKLYFQLQDGTDGDTLAAGESVTFTFTYTSKMANGVLSTAQVVVTMNGENDRPVLTSVEQLGAVKEDGTLSASGKVTATDVDHNDVLTYTVDHTQGTYGSIALNSSTGAWTYSLANGSDAVQKLAAGEHHTETFTVTVTDKAGAFVTQTVTVTVCGTNDAPVVTGAVTGAVTEGGAGSTLGALANASDVDNGAVLSVTNVPATLPAGVSYDAASKSFTIDPTNAAYDHLADGASTTVTVNYSVSDGITSTPASVSWTVTGTNDAPVVSGAVTGETTEGSTGDTLDALANASDVDDATTLSVTDVPATLPAGVTYDAATHSFSIDPTYSAYDYLAEGATTTVTVNYSVSDGTASVPASVSWTLTGTNDAAVITGSASDSADETNAALTLGGKLSATDVDSSADFVAQTGVAGDNGHGTFTIGADGTWSYTANSANDALNEGDSVTDNLTVATADGTTQVLTVTINGTNDGPAGSATGSLANATEDTSYTIHASDLLQGFSDVDGTLHVANVSINHGTVTDHGDGTYTVALASNYNGAATVSYDVVDNSNASVAASLSLTVDAVKDLSASDASKTTDEDNSVSGNVGATTTSGGALSYSIEGGTAHGSLLLNTVTGAYTYTPGANYNGADGFDIRVTDSAANESAVVHVGVTINPVNDPAVIGGTKSGAVVEAGSGNNGGTPSASGTLTASDVDNTPNTFEAVSTATASTNGYGSFTMTADGQWTYTLNNANTTVNALNDGGTLTDKFTVYSADHTAQEISVTITGANDGVVLPSVTTTDTGSADANNNDNASGNSQSATVDTNNNAATINGTSGNDTIYGRNLADTISGGDGNDTIYGGSGGDTLNGGNGDDVIYGGSGNDIIDGGVGNDQITGGLGADTLTGGAGNDRFFYLTLSDSGDTITDFKNPGADIINVSAIDANGTLSGDQGFAWGGTTATANGLWYATSGGNTVLYGDTDGNVSTAEFFINITGTPSLAAGDFVL